MSDANDGDLTHVSASAQEWRMLGLMESSPIRYADTPAPALRDDIRQLWRAFAPLIPELRRRALRHGDIEAAKAGDGFTAGQELAVVLSGGLLLFAEDSDVCAEIASAGDLIELGGGGHGRWISGGTVYRAPLSRFLSETGDEGLRFLLQAELERARRIETRLACATRHPALSRVAAFLVESRAAAGSADIPLCQSEIGAFLGLRRTSVNAACQTLRRAGALRTVRGRVIVTDLDRLASQACCRRETFDALSDGRPEAA